MLLIHRHHDVLAEKSDNMQERIDYIKAHKPANEVATRLRLLKKANKRAEKEWDALNAKWQSKRDALDVERQSKRNAWHAKYCGCAEWNGTEIVFPKEAL